LEEQDQVQRECMKVPLDPKKGIRNVPYLAAGQRLRVEDVEKEEEDGEETKRVAIV